jgi:hypothetical protein
VVSIGSRDDRGTAWLLLLPHLMQRPWRTLLPGIGAIGARRRVRAIPRWRVATIAPACAWRRAKVGGRRRWARRRVAISCRVHCLRRPGIVGGSLVGGHGGRGPLFRCRWLGEAAALRHKGGGRRQAGLGGAGGSGSAAAVAQGRVRARRCSASESLPPL